MLSDDALQRYSRQLLLPAFDVAGQEALQSATVLVVGAGGLGCPAALYLAAAGVGHLVVADGDTVEPSNLQRQIAHTTASVGERKTESLARALTALNPETRVTPVAERLAGETLADRVAAADIVVDGSDNRATRFALNAACVHHRRPLVSGAAIRLEGRLSVFDARRDDSPCYRCLYTDSAAPEARCVESGVLGPVVGVIGVWQALETVKLLSGLGEPLVGCLQVFDGGRGEWRSFRIPKDPACPVCGTGD